MREQFLANPTLSRRQNEALRVLTAHKRGKRKKIAMHLTTLRDRTRAQVRELDSIAEAMFEYASENEDAHAAGAAQNVRDQADERIRKVVKIEEKRAERKRARQNQEKARKRQKKARKKGRR